MQFQWNNRDYQYTTYRNKIPAKLADYNCKPFNLSIPVSKNWKEAKNKILVVLTHIPSVELRNGKLMSSEESQTCFTNLVNQSLTWSKQFGKVKDFEFAFINYNSYSDYHLKKARYRSSQVQASKRVRSFIKKMKPDTVLVFGTDSAEYILKKNNIFPLQGKIFPLEVKGKTSVWKTKVVHTLDFNQVLPGKGNTEYEHSSFRKDIDKANTLGYVYKVMASAFLRKQPIKIVGLEPNYIYVDTIGKFKKFYKKLEAHEGPIAVDTETDNLNVINNRILMIQFAFSKKVGYVLPYYHKQTPFSPKELEYIRKKLSKFFNKKPEKYNSVYLLFQNGSFDIPLIRREYNIPCLYYSVYDTQAAEFCLDENYDNVKMFSRTEFKPWALNTILEKYGSSVFRKTKFGKSDRANIRNTDLTEDVLKYGALDVQSLIAIHEVQLKTAASLTIKSGKKFVSYKPVFKRFVLLQMSSMIKVMSEMRYRGIPIDPNHLLKIRSSDSPVLKIQEEVKKSLYEMGSVKKANKILLKRKGIPTKGLFNNASQNWVFSIDKVEHKQLLYFDILKLEPLDIGKSGNGRLDQSFQKAYKDSVEEVSILNRLNKLKVLYDTFCKGLYEKYTKDPDMRTDGNLRPGYGYLTVVTGRSNSFNPSLQNIPEHSKESKHVKRTFFTREGELIIKLDYSAHEINCWGLISRDESLAEVFSKAFKFINKYRLNPSKKKKKLLKSKADVHRLNYSLFTGVPITKVDDNQRKSSKGITFGCFTGDTIVSTANGPMRVGTLANTSKTPAVLTQGGEVLPSGGAETRGMKPIVGVMTRQAYLKGTASHKVLRITPDLKLKMTPLSNLRVGDAVVYQRGNFGTGTPKLAGKKISLLDAEAMGLWTADGHANAYPAGIYRVHHCSIDKKEVRKVRDFFYRHCGVKAPLATQIPDTQDVHYVQINNKVLFNKLTNFGLTGNQHERRVPESILTANKEYVRAYLRGYFEGDGGFRFTGKLVQISATTVNPVLASDIAYLLNMFGIDCSIYGSANGKTGTCEVILSNADSVLTFIKEIGFITDKKLKLCKLAKERIKNYSKRHKPDLALAKAVDYKKVRTLYKTKAGVNTFRSRKVYANGVHIPRIPKHLINLLPVIHTYAEAFKALGMEDQWKTIELLSRKGSFASIVYREAEPLGKEEVFDVINVVRNHTWSANGVIVSNSMYGMSIPALAKSIKKAVDETKEILDRFFKKYFKASKWLEWARKFSVKNLYVFSPLGRKRNLPAYLTGLKTVYNALQRRSVNSPIQGLASDFGFMAACLILEAFHQFYEKLVDEGVEDPVKDGLMPFGINKMVHDSIEIRCPYEYVLPVLRILEYCTTIGVRVFCEKMYGMKFLCDLGVDFEIGSTGDTLLPWDFSDGNLRSILKKSLLVHKNELGYKVNTKKTLSLIYKGGKKYNSYLRKTFPIPKVDKHRPYIFKEIKK